jgi:hypothetical protein
MSDLTEGSAFSLMVMPAVVWGTKTVQSPSLVPAAFTACLTSAVMSMNSSLEWVLTVMDFMFVLFHF